MTVIPNVGNGLLMLEKIVCLKTQPGLMDEIPFGHDFFFFIKKKVSTGFSDELQPVPKF